MVASIPVLIQLSSFSIDVSYLFPVLNMTWDWFHAFTLFNSIFSFCMSLEAFTHRCSAKKVFLEISQNSQENTCARASFKKRVWHRCFPVNFVIFLRTPFLQKTSWRLLLCLISMFRIVFMKSKVAAHLE